MKQNWGKR